MLCLIGVLFESEESNPVFLFSSSMERQRKYGGVLCSALQEFRHSLLRNQFLIPESLHLGSDVTTLLSACS